MHGTGERKEKDTGAGAGEFWDGADLDLVRRVSWLSTPYFTRHAVWKFLGDDARGELVPSLHVMLKESIGEERSGKPLRGLALACGDMCGERELFSPGVLTFGTVEGIDLSEEQLRRARENCEGWGFEFVPIKGDLNTMRLREERYDLVVANHAVHHVAELEHLFSQVNRALRPGGYFFCNEYVGPERLQVPLRNRLWASLLVNLLVWPPSRRRTHEGRSKAWIRNINPATLDPSEAVRSSEILSACGGNLRVEKLHLYGGLNYPAFEGLGLHFSVCEEDERLLRRFIFLEDVLTRLRLVKPLFCYLLAGKAP
jgi:SAM-dependent methyltransferase